MYEFYFDKVLLPVTPDKLTMKIGGANKTFILMNEGEIDILKSPKLTEVEFDVLLPNVEYPFAVYGAGFVPAVYYLDMFKKYKQEKKPFQFKVTRTFPNGKAIFDTDMKVSLESYSTKESAENGFDIVVSVKLKQYRDFGTKTCTVNLESAKPTAAVNKSRAVSDNAPTTAGKEKTITVKQGDTLWAICKEYLGDGSAYPTVAKENKISNPNLLQIGQKIILTTNVTTPNALSKKAIAKFEDTPSGGSKNKAPFAILTASYGVARSGIKTWNEALGYYTANGGAGKGWKIVDADRSVITL